MIEEKSNRATLKQKAQRGKGTEAQSAEVPQSRSAVEQCKRAKDIPLTLALSRQGRGDYSVLQCKRAELPRGQRDSGAVISILNNTH